MTLSWSAISPDGRWIAHESTETGDWEIYVRPFPNVQDGKWQISNAGGEVVRWGPEGRELFYREGSPTGPVMAVAIETEPTFSAGTPRSLLTGNYGADYAVAGDGKFLMLIDTQQTGQTNAQTVVVVVENWFEELKRLAPPAE